jgi:hypothetical protein
VQNTCEERKVQIGVVIQIEEAVGVLMQGFFLVYQLK